ncbi:MAG: hypothetical protein COW00_10625 [Bdellovibrio sp. CG12_big_fil_rev_8_21_14_0_65_39_13]|nr:MAG: hypothetical protein COW78_13750 [Bdellovibrio sp. CG22_combo_CG10-13_8_21_14_all_39_27]PIQ59402.1 MAG: hypothetical protein COW00_10625 [Bdellovibrio sp. CG12_big_fil_rev_8_21_14_0_65_39_13]PIR34942.1 MAG: hypothetical protein COV37_11820 [Bdellovibrio sp. CG11_big_fil_rev_8_21_14_0_20_39_38]
MLRLTIRFVYLSLLIFATCNVYSADYLLDNDKLCQGFPRARIGSLDGTCVGVVALKHEGMLRPRKILEIEPNHFLITDMGGWVANKGSLWSLKILGPGKSELVQLKSGLDQVHGLAMDSKKRIYFGERSRITRFEINSEELVFETVVNNLPSEGKHALTHFIIDEQDRLIVNRGAPSDQCLNSKGKPQYPCPEVEGENPEAALYRLTLDESGNVIKSELLARGLRNSMGLAIHPESGILLQADNGMDFNKESLPHDELNVIKPDKHYGWPYCFDQNQLNPNYKRTIFNRSVPKINCSGFENPSVLLGAHSAPLDMFFYKGSMFPELNQKLIVSYHGYQPAGHRISFLDLNLSGFAKDEEKNILFDWDAKRGIRPQGSPVGITEAHDGKIWFVEDKNNSIMFISTTSEIFDDTTSEVPQVSLARLDEAGRRHLNNLSTKLFQPVCSTCHAVFAEKDLEVLHQKLFTENMLDLDNPQQSELSKRVHGLGGGMMMPPGGSVSEEMKNELKDYLDTIKKN